MISGETAPRPGQGAAAARTRGRLTASELEGTLPHRFPFALLDCVEEIEVGTRAVGVLLPSRSSWYVMGHFPGNPVVPGVVLIEALAQLAGVVLGSALSAESPAAKFAAQSFVLAGVKQIRFRQTIVPGETVRLEAKTTARHGSTAEFSVAARVRGAVAADGSLQLAAVPASRLP